MGRGAPADAGLGLVVQEMALGLGRAESGAGVIQFVDGSTGQPQIGTEIELDPGLLARLGPIYKGLNHIHKHQAITGAVYAGSICRLDFAEMEPKGFIEIEYQRDGKTWEHRWRFVPLDVPKMIHVDGDLSRERFLIDSVDGEPVSHGPETPG